MSASAVTYTVRSLGHSAWATGLSLGDAVRERDAAELRGMTSMVIVDDTTDMVVTDSGRPTATAAQIRRLWEEADAAGDTEQARLCEAAGLGDSAAHEACVRAIAAAKANAR